MEKHTTKETQKENSNVKKQLNFADNHEFMSEKLYGARKLMHF